MTQATYQPEERARKYRQLSEQSIQCALASQWEQAVETNRELLQDFPRDLSALNRLGKALSELGRYRDAMQAYTEALDVDPGNTIAKKNLDRLTPLSEQETSGRHAGARFNPRFFIEETGKTGFTDLVDLASHDLLAPLAAGDQVTLVRDGNALYAADSAGRQIGRIEPRLSNRLIKYMESGNQYAAAIADLEHGQVRLILRETFQHPNMFGRVSFPASRTTEVGVRAYIKDTMLRHDVDEEDEEGEEGEFAEESDEESEEGSNEEEFQSDFAEPEE